MSFRFAFSSAKLKTIKVTRVSLATFLTIAPLLLAVVLPSPPVRATPACGATMSGGSASDWLGGSGVDIYSNGTDQNTGKDCVVDDLGQPDTQNTVTQSGGNVVTTGYEWQCVEMVNRLYATKGWISSRWSGSGNTLKDHLPANTNAQPNGAISSVVPGDVITLNDNGSGHAAIVNSVNSSTGAITFISQNAPLSTTVSLSSGSLAGGNATYATIWGNYNVQAVIHSSLNSGSGSDTALQMLLNNSNQVFAQSGIGTTWQSEASGNIVAIAAGGGKQMLLDSFGDVWDDSSVGGTWSEPITGGTVAIAAGGTNGLEMILNSSNQVFARVNGGPWTYEAATNIVAIAAGGSTQMMLDSSGDVWDETSVGQSWSEPVIGGTVAIAAGDTNGLEMLLNSSNQVFARTTGGLWTSEASGNITKIAAGGSTQMLLDSSGDVWGENSVGTTGWDEEVITGMKDIAAADNGTQMILDTANDAVWARSDIGSVGWNYENATATDLIAGG